MRASTFLVLLFLWPALAIADVQWHKFAIGGEGDKQSLTIGQVSLTIQTRDVRNADFKENYLVMTVHVPGQQTSEYWFTSSYGYGEVAVHGNLLLLKYGVGRGTFVRVDHVRALRLHDGLEELVDVQSSYYVLTDPKNDHPALVEYRLRIQTKGGYTTLSFSLPKPQKGIPSEKIVRLKSDG
jgi:hypothetical protein